MIIRLSTIQVSTHWNAIKDMIKRALPDLPGQLANRDNNIFRSLLMAESICWIAYKKTAEKQNDIQAMLITKNIYDKITGIRSLLIYCFAGWTVMSDDFYREGFESLKAFGRETNCHRIVFYSDEVRSLNITEKLGFDLSLHYGRFQL